MTMHKMKLFGFFLFAFLMISGTTIAAPVPTDLGFDDLPFRWERLGTRKVNYNLDRDEIGVTALEGRFTALQMRVKNAPINLHKVTVHYRNGRPQTVNVRQTVRAGGQTRTLDLNGGKRVITKIVFWYDTKNLAARRGKIELWGKH
ncbi:MAG: hypothetical protein AAF242_15220 [Bacteroidota bacterium]